MTSTTASVGAELPASFSTPGAALDSPMRHTPYKAGGRSSTTPATWLAAAPVDVDPTRRVVSGQLAAHAPRLDALQHGDRPAKQPRLAPNGTLAAEALAAPALGGAPPVVTAGAAAETVARLAETVAARAVALVARAEALAARADGGAALAAPNEACAVKVDADVPAHEPGASLFPPDAYVVLPPNAPIEFHDMRSETADSLPAALKSAFAPTLCDAYEALKEIESTACVRSSFGSALARVQKLSFAFFSSVRAAAVKKPPLARRGCARHLHAAGWLRGGLSR